MSVRTGITATAVAAVLAVGGLAGASTALADSTATPSPSSAGSLKTACKHVDKQLTRVGKLQTRLHAGAATRGSILFLAARIDRAKADGQTSLARVLEDRMAVRKQVDSQLPEVVAHLRDAKATCVAAGEPA